MNVYVIHFEGEDWYVVASDYRSAHEAWRHKMEQEADTPIADQPESIALLGEMYAQEDPR